MWQEHILNIADGQLLWCDKRLRGVPQSDRGTGKSLIFLHGGPGDEYRYLLPFAESFTSHFHCILYDQRGSGGSKLERIDQSTVHPDRFVLDLEQLRLELQHDQVILVGHSWGAMLALLYGAAYPKNVERLVLIGLGPLNEEMDRVAKANLIKPLSSEERQEYARLSQKKHKAIQTGDKATVTAINRERMKLSFRGICYDCKSINTLVENWLEYELYRNWFVNRIVNQLLDRQKLWERLPQVNASTLVLYGYQDFEPIVQAYLLKEQMPNVELCFINECGHIPWLEQPDKVKQAIMKFLDPESY